MRQYRYKLEFVIDVETHGTAHAELSEVMDGAQDLLDCAAFKEGSLGLPEGTDVWVTCTSGSVRLSKGK